jgi:hypothetical protein
VRVDRGLSLPRLLGEPPEELPARFSRLLDRLLGEVLGRLLGEELLTCLLLREALRCLLGEPLICLLVDLLRCLTGESLRCSPGEPLRRLLKASLLRILPAESLEEGILDFFSRTRSARPFAKPCPIMRKPGHSSELSIAADMELRRPLCCKDILLFERSLFDPSPSPFVSVGALGSLGDVSECRRPLCCEDILLFERSLFGPSVSPSVFVATLGSLTADMELRRPLCCEAVLLLECSLFVPSPSVFVETLGGSSELFFLRTVVDFLVLVLLLVSVASLSPDGAECSAESPMPCF